MGPSDPRARIAEHARTFWQRGWMWGTAGNLSARADADSFWITASGRRKGEITPDDFVRVGLDGTVHERGTPDARPSAETSIHQALYTRFPETGAVYHVHSPEANVAARLTRDARLPLPPLEMLKGFGLWVEAPQVYLELFANPLHVPAIGTAIAERFAAGRAPDLAALLIRDHGVTVWGADVTEARDRIELIEYVFRFVVAARGAGVWSLDDPFAR